MQGKYSRPSNHTPALIILIILVVLLALFAVFQMLQIRQLKRDLYAQRMVYEEQLAAATETTAPPAQTEMVEPETEPTTEATEPPTEATEPPTEDYSDIPEETADAQYMIVDAAAQPSHLTSLLDACQSDYDFLSKKQCTQLVTVQANGNTAQVRFYTFRDGSWWEEEDLACMGHVGRNGITTTKEEGDGCTPQGLYSIGSGFYINDEPRTKLDLFQITEDTYWIDDPDSIFYNQRVEGTENKDWDSAEHMIDYDVYRYGFVVNYNLPVKENAGSAIFFHVGLDSTAGCISVQEQMVLRYLRKLDKECNPYILMVDPAKA